MVAACAVLSCGAGLAADDLNPITLSFYDQWGHFKVEGSFFVKAENSTAWKVLTNYGQIPQFVHSMKVSKVLNQNGEDLVLQQEGEGGFLFFTQRIHLLLNVHENPEKSIVFEDSGHKDFSFYQGSWTLTPSPDGSLEVVYTLDAEEHFGAPAFLVGDSIQGSVRDLLQSVQKEITEQQLTLNQKKSTQNFIVRGDKTPKLPASQP